MFNGHALRSISESGKNSAISSRKSKSAALLNGCGKEAGSPEGRSDEFWILAQNRLTSDTGDGRQEHATR
jgi:hypothetical protein